MLSRRVAQSTFKAATQQSSLVTRIAAVRGYAAAAPDSKPPIAIYGIDGTYASALYTAAAKSNTLDGTAKAMENLSNVFKRDTKLASVLGAPTLSNSDKQQIVQELERHTGGADKGNTVKNFLSTLAENNRLGILEAAAEKFGELMGAARGEMELVVTSAARLEPKMLQRLESAVAKSEYSQGKKLKVVTKVDPSVLGGLVVEIGDRTIDYSVSSKIARLNKALTDAI